MATALALAMILASAPSSASPEPSTDDSPKAGEDDAAYLAAVAELTAGVDAARREPSEAVAKLRPALAAMADYAPQLAFTPADLRQRDLAQLALALSLIALGDEAAATAVIDEALRSARGSEPLPVAGFGPAIAKLVAAREQELGAQGSAELEVRCAVACRLFIDERSASETTQLLLLGEYRLWIEARDGSVEPLRTTVTLDARGQTVVIDFAAPEPEPIPEPEPEPTPEPILEPTPELAPAPTPAPIDAPPTRSPRMLPRWAELTGLGVGVALAIAGGVILSYDGKCPGGFDPTVDFDECPKVYRATKPGFGLLGVGLGVAALGGVMLTIDEIRVGRDRREHQAMLWWTLRF